MSKTLRLQEKWFRRGLWLVAAAFAIFLTGLGSLVVGDLPRVGYVQTLEDFIDPAAVQQVKAKEQEAEAAGTQADDALEQAELAYRAARTEFTSSRETFENWVSTRQATARPEQDPELIARTKALDQLKAAERRARAVVDTQQKIQLDARQALSSAHSEWSALRAVAEPQWRAEVRAKELRVFLLRLALTLPLLVLAGWLFVKKRRSMYWPFVWGFIFFALFAFFVELVPYLPNYGGYVRYIVGIVLTVLVGRYAIVGLNRYLERQKQAEHLPDVQRRESLSYDTVLAHLAKSACPGCERPVDLKDGRTDFCPHCGMGLFNHCGVCHTRKSAFSPYCLGCGAAASAGLGAIVKADQAASAALLHAGAAADDKPAAPGPAAA